MSYDVRVIDQLLLMFDNIHYFLNKLFIKLKKTYKFYQLKLRFTELLIMGSKCI